MTAVDTTPRATLGTNDDNVADMMDKGRQARGERSGHAKLTREDVLSIRELHARGRSSASLAEMFGISRQGIDSVTSRRTWRHV